MIIEPSGPKCECGRFGCLEAIVGEDALRRKVEESQGRSLSRGELLSLVAAGDVSTLEIVRNAGGSLAWHWPT